MPLILGNVSPKLNVTVSNGTHQWTKMDTHWNVILTKALGTWDFNSSKGTKINFQTLLQVLQFKSSPSLETIHISEYTCPGTAGMRSNVSCRHWVSTALGGLSVTPRACVKVDQRPDGFSFPHSFSLFSYCGRYRRASQILRRDGISGRSLVLLQSRCVLLTATKKEKI